VRLPNRQADLHGKRGVQETLGAELGVEASREIKFSQASKDEEPAQIQRTLER